MYKIKELIQEYEIDTQEELAARLARNGLLVLTAGDALRLLPPLTITQAELDRGLEILKQTLS